MVAPGSRSLTVLVGRSTAIAPAPEPMMILAFVPCSTTPNVPRLAWSADAVNTASAPVLSAERSSR